jgi:hypothetical protein
MEWLAETVAVAVLAAVHLLPCYLPAVRGTRSRTGGLVPLFDEEVYLLMLLGLAAFYGLERLVQVTPGEERSTEARIVMLSIGGFCIYYALIGYLLWDVAGQGVVSLAGGMLAYAGLLAAV